MVETLEILSSHIGNAGYNNAVVLRGRCSFCGDRVTFRQMGDNSHIHKQEGRMVAVQCEGCSCILSFSPIKKQIYPEVKLMGLDSLPKEIQTYYDESLRCLSSNCPNGAMTLFRKIIHALGIHYNLAERNTKKSMNDIIEALQKEGHIQEKLKKALLEVKEFGNDGAHINENEPTLEQAFQIKMLIESVLTTSIYVDDNLAKLNKIRE